MASTFLNLPAGSTTTIGALEVAVSAANDSIKISDGTDTLAVNADGSLNVSLSGSLASVDTVITGLNEYEYNEEIGVAIGATVTAVTYTFGANYKLRKINCTGDNLAIWTVVLDGDDIDKRRSNFTNLNCDFDYETGITMPSGSTLEVKVTNSGNSIGEFSARLLFSPK